MERTAEPVVGNGQPSGESGERDVAPELSPAIAGLRSEMEALDRERAHYQAKLDLIAPTLKKYERAIAILEGSTPGPGRPAKVVKSPVRARPAGIGPERLERTKEAILGYAADHEEFRQVDIRTITGFTSSNTATAFENLRQEPYNLIRFARQEGINKWYRLTREALSEQ